MTSRATVALVLTDVEGSSRLWRDAPEPMNAAMARHHQLVAEIVAAHGGWRPADQGEGDSTFIAFESAASAVAAAVELQQALARETWPTPEPVRVRIGVHVGEVVSRDGNLFGETVSRCARIRGIGHGGQTLLSGATYELVRDRLPGGLTLRSLGEHRMKDLVRPEPIWQLDHPDLPRDFPPLASLDVGRHNLPAQLTRFIAREAEVAHVVGLLRDGARLVTITGFGGMGKTRLSLAVAAELVDRSANGVWFVDLSGVADPDDVPREIGSVIGAHDTGQGMVEAVLEHVAAKQMLLVLDNLEQVVECASFVARMLSTAPGVQVLGTSREPLQLRGEVDFRLEPFPTSGHAPDDAGAAMALFVERAREARRGFVIGDDAEFVAAICARLDGVPLAIELAAARAAMLPPRELFARLDRSLAVLSDTHRDRPDRHRTVRAAVKWSFDLLTADEQTLVTRMSVFPGPVGLDAVEVICTAVPGGARLDVFEVLASLLDKSLVRRAEQDDAPRFSLLVPVREFAAEQLAEVDRAALADAHLDYFLARSVAGTRTADGPEEQPWFDEIHREAHHFRAALAHAEDAGRTHEHLLLAANLFELWHSGGHRLEGRSRLDRARAAVGTSTADRALLAFATSAQGWFSIDIPAAADTVTRLGVEIAESTGDLPVSAFAFQSLGVAQRRAASRAAFHRAVQLACAARAAGSAVRWGITRPDAVEIGAGLMLITFFDRWEDPRGAFQRAAQLRQRAADAGRVGDEAHAEFVMGQLAADVGDVGTATALLDRAIAVFEERYDDVNGARAILERASARARARLDTVEDFATQIDRYGDVLPLLGATAGAVLGDLLAVSGDLAGAEAAYRTAVARSPVVEDAGWRLVRLDRLAGKDTRPALEDVYRRSTGEVVAPRPEVLGCLVEAALVAEQYGDPARAALLTGTVQGMRGPFLLPEVVLSDLDALVEHYPNAPLHTVLPETLFG